MYNDFQKAKKSIVGTMIFGVILRLTFWLGLIFGLLWIAKYFGILQKFI